MLLFTRRTLGLTSPLYMLSVYLPFSNRLKGLLFSFTRHNDNGFRLSAFNDCKFFDIIK